MRISAVHQGGYAHDGLKGRHRQTVTEGDGDGIQLAPPLRHDRLGAFRQFGA